MQRSSGAAKVSLSKTRSETVSTVEEVGSGSTDTRAHASVECRHQAPADLDKQIKFAQLQQQVDPKATEALAAVRELAKALSLLTAA